MKRCCDSAARGSLWPLSQPGFDRKQLPLENKDVRIICGGLQHLSSPVGSFTQLLRLDQECPSELRSFLEMPTRVNVCMHVCITAVRGFLPTPPSQSVAARQLNGIERSIVKALQQTTRLHLVAVAATYDRSEALPLEKQRRHHHL